MVTRSRWTRALLIAGGYGAALWAAWALVELRYRGVDPADVSASSGMYAFGDVAGFLIVGGVLSLAPTWFLFRAIRGSSSLWTALSWTCVAWGALAPLAVAAFRLVTPPPPLAPGATGEALSPWQSAAAVLSALALLRILVSPGSLLILAAAWWLGRDRAARRRALWAAGLELCALVPVAGWLAVALLAGRGH